MRKKQTYTFPFLLCILCILISASCSAKSTSIFELTNAQNGASIDLGMKREDVEESALSYEENPIESPFKSLFHVSYGRSMENRIDITYNSDQVIVAYSVGGQGAGEGDGLIVQDHSIWRLNGISLDSSIHDTIDVFGLPTQPSKEFLDEQGNALSNADLILYYYFDAENELLTPSSSLAPSSLLVFHFDNGKLRMIEAALEDIS